MWIKQYQIGDLNKSTVPNPEKNMTIKWIFHEPESVFFENMRYRGRGSGVKFSLYQWGQGHWRQHTLVPEITEKVNSNRHVHTLFAELLKVPITQVYFYKPFLNPQILLIGFFGLLYSFDAELSLFFLVFKIEIHLIFILLSLVYYFVHLFWYA